jgi:hypothetical protein
MVNIGFGIFCFGEEHYYKGTIEKINNIINFDYDCFILTENIDYFKEAFINTEYIHFCHYDREYKSYHDKMSLVNIVLKNHDIVILIDADTYIKDYSFLSDLRGFNFKEGITYIDTLLNHNARRKFVKELINKESDEWKPYINYVSKLYPDFGEFETMWEYFLIINKNGFNSKKFYYFYERLQLAKEFSDLPYKKVVNGAGEGISIQVAGKLSETNVERDLILYDMLKNKMTSLSKRFIRPELWPDWMK